jgi:hypothetical protein
MSKPTIFISYRHAPPTAAIASRLYIALVPAAEVWEPADLFDTTIIAALDRTTHFIVLLTNAYWSSPYCRKEMARIVERFEHDRSVRLLFVMVEELQPEHFTFAKDRASGRIVSDDPVLRTVGDVQFLGPFDESRRLVRLKYDNDALLGDQLAQLIRRLERVITPRR